MSSFNFRITDDSGVLYLYFDWKNRFVALHIVYPDYTTVVKRDELFERGYENYDKEVAVTLREKKRKIFHDALGEIKKDYESQYKELRNFFKNNDPEMFGNLKI